MTVADIELMGALRDLLDGFERMGEKLGMLTQPVSGFQPTPFGMGMMPTPMDLPMMMTAPPMAPVMSTPMLMDAPLTPPYPTMVSTSPQGGMSPVTPHMFPVVTPLPPPPIFGLSVGAPTPMAPPAVTPNIRMGRGFPDPFEAFLENRQSRIRTDLEWEKQKDSFWAGEGAFFAGNTALAIGGITGGVLAGGVGIAAYMGGSAISDAFHDAEWGGALNLRSQATAVNRLMKPLITSGPELGISGRGFNVAGATKMAGAMSGMAQKRGLADEDMRAVLSSSIDEGLLNDVNSLGMAIEKLEKIMGLMGKVAKMTGSPDFQRNLQYIGQFSRMGVNIEDIQPMMQNMTPFARMAGVDLGSAMQQGGAMGASSFANAGFAPTLGIQTGVMSQGVARAAVSSGQIGASDLARMGGEEGVAGGVQQGITQFYSKMRDYTGYFATRDASGAYQIDKQKVAQFLSDNTTLEDVKKQSLEFVANMSRADREKFAGATGDLMAGLQETMGAENALAGAWAYSRKLGRQYETPLMSSETVLGDNGFSPLAAKALGAAFGNTGVQGAMLQQQRAGQMREQAGRLVERERRGIGTSAMDVFENRFERMDLGKAFSFQWGKTEFETLSKVQGGDIEAELAAVGLGGTAVNTLLTGGMEELTKGAIEQIVTGEQFMPPPNRRNAIQRMNDILDHPGVKATSKLKDALGGGIQDETARYGFIRAIGGKTGTFTNTAMEQILGNETNFLDIGMASEGDVRDASTKIQEGLKGGLELASMRSEAVDFPGFKEWLRGKTDGKSREVALTHSYNTMLRSIKGDDLSGAAGMLETGLTKKLEGMGYNTDEARRGARAFIGTKMQEEGGTGLTKRLRSLMMGASSLEDPGAAVDLPHAQRMAEEKTTELHKALGVETTEDVASINEIVRKSGESGVKYLSLLAARDYMDKEGADTKAAADTSSRIEDEMVSIRQNLSAGQRATIEKAAARGVGQRLFEGEGEFRQAKDSTDTLNWQQFSQTLKKAGGLAGEAAPLMKNLQARQLEATLEEYYNIDVQEFAGLLTGKEGGTSDERLQRLREMRETMRRSMPAGANQRMVLQRFDEMVEMMPKLPSGELASFRTSEKLLDTGRVTTRSLDALDEGTRGQVQEAMGLEGGLSTDARRKLQNMLGDDKYEATMKKLAIRDTSGKLTGKEGVSAWELSQQLEGGKLAKMGLGVLASGLQAGGLKLLGGGKSIGSATPEELDAAMAQGGAAEGGVGGAGGGASATALSHAAAQLNIAASNLRKASGGMGRSQPARRGMGTLPRGW